MTDLDPKLRARLARLAKSEDGAGLDSMARQRVIARMPVDREPSRRFALVAAVAAFGVLALSVWLRDTSAAVSKKALAPGFDMAEQAMTPVDLRSADLRSADLRSADLRSADPQWASRSEPAPRCETLPVPRIRSVDDTAFRGSLRGIELPGRARVVLQPGAVIDVETAPCRTVIRLGRGKIAVHAIDLAEGELLVETELGQVRVHGTVFSVERRRRLRIQVVEGVVGVETPTGEELDRFRARQGGDLFVDGTIQSHRLGASEEEALWRMVEGRRPVTPVPRPQIRGSVTEGNPSVRPSRRGRFPHAAMEGMRQLDANPNE